MNYTSVAGPVSVYPQAKQFAEDYKKKFGKNPEPFAAQAYDSDYLTKMAASKRGEYGWIEVQDVSTQWGVFAIGGP
ncbi:MAG: hypothetical protein HC767_13370, partial [Akkermansiaceae bacterium]|nr:hypothetical protein [Akkermansiaceae bacterium]